MTKTPTTPKQLYFFVWVCRRIAFLTIIFFSTSYFLLGNELYNQIESFKADFSALNRKYTNRHSPEYFERMDKLFSDWIRKLETYDFASLSKDEKIDYLLFKNKLNKDRYFLNQSYTKFKEVSYVADFSDPLVAFYTHRRTGIKPDGKTLAQTFSETSQNLKRRHEQVATDKPFSSWQKAELASEVIKFPPGDGPGGLRILYELRPGIFMVDGKTLSSAGSRPVCL